MSTVRALLVLALVSGGAAQAQVTVNRDPAALEGVWSRVESFGPNTMWYRAQPGQRLFVDGHYSWIQVNTAMGAPRPAMPGADATAAQLRDVWGPFLAQAGRYEVRADTIVQYPIVAKDPAGMAPNTVERYSYRIVADSLWSTNVTSLQTSKYVRVRGVDQGGMRGAWRQQEIRNVASGQVTGNQPGFRFYVDGYFHWIRVNGLEARQPLNAQSTPEQIRATWGAGFTAVAGAYGMADDINIQVPIVSKDPNGMATGLWNTFTVRIAGDTMWSRNHASQVGPNTNPGEGRYIRVRSSVRAPTN
jgi:hypothetical protein